MQNRQRLAALLPAGAMAVLNANDILPTNADGTMPFRQNNDLFYLSGVDRNSVVKTIDVSDGKNVSIIATVATPDEYAQFLLFLRNATGVLFAAAPKLTTTGVGGYGNGAQPLIPPQPAPGSAPVVVNYPITLTAQGALLNPIVLPNDPTGAGGGAAVPGADPRALGGSPTGASPSATGRP